MNESDSKRASTQATRVRLLLAGAELFAARGFRATTVRAICTKARANIAAVNYHFRDKEGLYREVLKDSFSRAYEKFPPTLDLPPHPTPEQALRAWIRSFFFRLLDESPDAYHGPLLAREMAAPTAALGDLVERVLRPSSETLNSILRSLAGHDTPPPAINALAASVAGQILFYRHCRPILERLNPEIRYTRENLERWSEHVAQFSLAGIAALSAGASR